MFILGDSCGILMFKFPLDFDTYLSIINASISTRLRRDSGYASAPRLSKSCMAGRYLARGAQQSTRFNITQTTIIW